MMKKNFLLLLFLTFLGTFAEAQYGNEWIVSGQTYYKFTTAQDGMYAVTYSQLQAAGMNMSIDPRRYQLWHRGVEQNILIKGEADGQFNVGDSLIFYGKMNDGTQDVELYKNPVYQPHKYYSLYSDTAAFFLTWVATTSNKRMAVDPTNTVQPAESYHMAEFLKVYTDEYSRGLEYGEAYQSFGDEGETWCGPYVEGTYTENVNLSNLNTSAGFDCVVEVMIVGRNNTTNRKTVLRIGNLTIADIVDTFPVFDKQRSSYKAISIPASLLTSTLSVTVDGTPTAGNGYAMAYVRVKYPQNIVFGSNSSKVFYPANSSVQNYYSMNWSSSTPLVYNLTDKDNINILNTSFSSPTLGVFAPIGVTSFLVMQSNAYLKVPAIRLIDMTDYSTSADYLILTHKKLWSESLQYASYRSSAAGGSHNVLTADIEKIYNQFCYGEFNPMAIKRFCSYQKANNPNVKSLFIIGKGLDLLFKSGMPKYYRQDPLSFINNTIPNLRLENFVPPAGSPASDIMYVMNSSNQPSMAVGRLSARTGQDVINYLDKVIEHETVDSNYIWRKRLVHLSGGADAGQIDLFEDYVNQFKARAEAPYYFSGKVIKSYKKNLNNGTVDQIKIADDVNDGVAFITFYGHSSFSVTELDIGYVSKDIFGYRNKGKYPMMLINGCQSANCYFDYSLGEDWLNTPDRGAIAVLGVSDIGYTGPLKSYTEEMYIGMFNVDSLRQTPPAHVMKNMLNVRTFDSQTTHQMNFHGDPVVKIYNPSRPDYEISGDKEIRADRPELKCFISSYDSKSVTASTDSFRIGIPVKNFGIYDKDKFFIQVKRTVNGKETIYKEVEYNPVQFIDTLYFKIKNNNSPNFYGLNKFEILIDSRDTIHEMDENNNNATIEYFMSTSGVTCLFPKEFSIVHDQPITFVAQATSLFVDQKQYYLQLDTSYKFNSGYRRDTVVSSGSLVKWPNVYLKTNNNIDSTVYYWRVRFNTIASGEDTVWSTSSFLYIKDSPDGWSQSESPQFVKDVQSNISIDLADSTWKFANSFMDLYLTVYGDATGDDFDSTLFRVGEVETMFPGYWWTPCGNTTGSRGDGEGVSYKFNGIMGLVFDKSTVQNYFNGFLPLCGRYPKPIVQPFYTTGGNTIMLEAWLNAIPVGDYIIIGSNGNAFYDAWPASTKNLLKNSFGAKKIDLLNDKEPYILLARKGDTLALSEKHSDNIFTNITLDTTLSGKYNSGTITSTRIGPATKWGTFYQKVDSTQGTDRYVFKVLGEKFDGTIDTLNLNLAFVKNVQGVDTVDLDPLINANTYPYIRLLCTVYDSSFYLTPPQLKKWQVIYHKSPEGTMNPFVAGLDNYTINTKEEGAKICIPYVFENISDLPFQDSLYVKITARSNGVVAKDTSFVVYPDTLDPGESFRFTHCLNTKGVTGRVNLRTFVNPNIQPEEYYTNNVIETNFEVIKDRIPPVIDVMFDGVHIMDGDIVSPSPVISIVLNDNSKYLLIKDPSDIQIYFQSAGSNERQILPTDPEVLRFGQSPGAGNTFTIDYNPKNLPDGDYTIIVQGKDVNGNKSGQFYKITFRVENASTISNFYPYPNPFSTSTRFVFTLTGHYIPDDLKIQIMTVSGKVVREITKEELGHIHIGNNKTEFAWNGTDEFGDKLANGVYLYRVILKNKGDNFEHRSTAGDKAFKKEFGKIYILR